MHRQKVSLLVDPLRRLLRRGARAHASNLLSKLHAADVARLLQILDYAEADEVFEILHTDDAEVAGEVLSELETVDAVRLLEQRDDAEVVGILAELAADDAAELVAALPEDVAQRILRELDLSGQQQVEEVLGYEEETAGRIMSTDVFALHEDVTVSAAIDELRKSKSGDLEMVFYLYVTDQRGHLVGVCSLRDLLLCDPAAQLREVMFSRLVSVGVDTDQEEVAQLVARYNFLALPVLDRENKLAGLITVDDVIDIIREEETEDILLMAGVGEDEELVLTAPLWRNAGLRLPWLFAAWVGGLAASQVIVHYTGLLEEAVILTAFIPIIAGMGGNVGTQASTIVVRGLATGRLTSGDWLRPVLREVRVALTLGVFFGALLGVVAQWLNPAYGTLGLAVGLALFTSMSIAATVGAVIPMVLRRFGVDPAIATGPFVTTAVDVLGIVAYFGIASALVL